MAIVEEIFNIIAPHECLNCQKEGSLLCYECGIDLAVVPPRCYACQRWDDASRTCRACRNRTPIHNLWTVARYEGVAKELVHCLKFERSRAAATPIARLLAQRVAVPLDTVVVPVPTAPSRVRERGYDQAVLIAKELARLLDRPYLPCLARSGAQRQVGKTRDIRKKQMEGAFRPIREAALHNKHVLLVDDVLTTGATCESAARALRQAGAKRVSAAVFAVA